MKTPIGRWNYETHEYDDYYPDPSWHILLYAKDMNQLINCTKCGAELTYGDSLTSLELHNRVGLGFPVCQDCYDVELQHKDADKWDDEQW